MHTSGRRAPTKWRRYHRRGRSIGRARAVAETFTHAADRILSLPTIYTLLSPSLASAHGGAHRRKRRAPARESRLTAARGHLAAGC